MKVSIVIPARLASTRLPRKMLAEIDGKPLLEHAWCNAIRASCANEVIVATDSEEIQAVVQEWGGTTFMTSASCRSGTERIASILDRLCGELILNVQGDEPFLDPLLLDRMASEFEAGQAEIVTPVFTIQTVEELADPNLVKVCRGANGRAVYFSRSPVPYMRGVPFGRWVELGQYWGHVGVYGYSRKTLAKYTSLEISPLELAEKLEQLRFLDAGMTIQTIEASSRPMSVDTLEDLQKVREVFAEKIAGTQENTVS